MVSPFLFHFGMGCNVMIRRNTAGACDSYKHNDNDDATASDTGLEGSQYCLFFCVFIEFEFEFGFK